MSKKTKIALIVVVIAALGVIAFFTARYMHKKALIKKIPAPANITEEMIEREIMRLKENTSDYENAKKLAKAAGICVCEIMRKTAISNLVIQMNAVSAGTSNRSLNPVYAGG